MTDLIVILVVAGDFETNFTTSLAEGPPHHWGFNKPPAQVAALEKGSAIAFLEVLDEAGVRMNRFSKPSPDLRVRRLVRGIVAGSVGEAEDPRFEGFTDQFTFDVAEDRSFAEPATLAEVAEVLSDTVVSVTSEQVLRLIKDAKSAKLGVLDGGEHRTADDYRDRSALSRRRTGTPTVPSPPSATAGPIDPLGAACRSFTEAVEASGLVFKGLNGHLPAAFFAAVATKGFAILSGLSGSGKTQLARVLGGWLSDDEERRFEVVPVRPDWTSPESLLGYEDALLPTSDDGRRAWVAPDPLRFLLRAAKDPSHVYLLVLDEMNLAHVERYFADVLSGIESNEPVLPNLSLGADGHWRCDPDRPLLTVPPNVLVVGTVNVDETTYQFSPKVLDRAFTFEFRVGSDELTAELRRISPVPPAGAEHTSALLGVLADPGYHHERADALRSGLHRRMVDLHEELTPAGFEFGHRTMFEAQRFAGVLAAVGIEEPDEVYDWVLMTKILPRLHGSRRQIEPLLDRLVTLAAPSSGSRGLPLTTRKVERMRSLVQANQFVSFAE